MRHPRHVLAWFCIVATLWMGVGFQLHDLSHSLQSLQASKQETPLPTHAPACEQCLFFTAIDGSPPTHALALLPTTLAAWMPVPAATSLRSTAFTAYACRAPPSLG